MLDSFSGGTRLIQHISRTLDQDLWNKEIFPEGVRSSSEASAVLFLLGRNPRGRGFDPCVILTKRSQDVKQSGDLCCPGGRISLLRDRFFSSLLTLPAFPLKRWPNWRKWQRQRPLDAKRIAMLFATSLRESFEEMRLNPLGVTFLGPLPPQELRIFRRVIYPMAAWINRQQRFVTNREVEKVVYIRLRDLLNPENYCRYRLEMKHSKEGAAREVDEFPCFCLQCDSEREILWGATYRIVTVFLEVVFGFEPPVDASLSVYHGTLDENYYLSNSV
jgi:hypothetical protein